MTKIEFEQGTTEFGGSDLDYDDDAYDSSNTEASSSSSSSRMLPTLSPMMPKDGLMSSGSPLMSMKIDPDSLADKMIDEAKRGGSGLQSVQSGHQGQGQHERYQRESSRSHATVFFT